MADNTSNYGLPYPEPRDGVVVHADIERLARRVDTVVPTAVQSARDSAIQDATTKYGDLPTRVQEAEAQLEGMLPREEAEQYGIEGPPSKVPGPEGAPGPPGPGGSIALEETDPGCFADSEITWVQWDAAGTEASVWNPVHNRYELLHTANHIRTDTSVGTRVFVGDTMIHGDTGRRNIRDSHVVQENITAGGRAWIQRTNNTVRVSLYDLTFTSSGTVKILASLPIGFRPIDREGYVLAISNRENREAIVLSSGIHLYQVPEDGGRLRATLSWETADPWPTSLPGIPA